MRVAAWVMAAMLEAHVCWSQSPIAAGPNGNGSTPAANPAPFGSEQHPVRLSGGLMAGNIVHKVIPVYPPAAEEMRGAVVMSVLIDHEGKVAKATIISGPELLRESTLIAVKRWTYKPFLLNG